MLLEKLCNASGVSGDENEVREIIKNEIEPYTDELSVDSMGNLIAKKIGKNHNKTVMLSCHIGQLTLCYKSPFPDDFDTKVPLFNELNVRLFRATSYKSYLSSWFVFEIMHLSKVISLTLFCYIQGLHITREYLSEHFC